MMIGCIGIPVVDGNGYTILKVYVRDRLLTGGVGLSVSTICNPDIRELNSNLTLLIVIYELEME